MRSITHDEAITLLQSAGNAIPTIPEHPVQSNELKTMFVGYPSFDEIREDLTNFDTHPIFYFWIMSHWRWFVGHDLFSARLFSIIFYSGSVLSLYALLKASNFKNPLFPSLLYALSHITLVAGYTARSYSLVSFLVIFAALSAYCCTRAKSNNEFLGFSVLLLISIILAVHTNYLAVFLITGIFGWYFVSSFSKQKILTSIITTSTILGLFSVLPILSQQINNRPQQYQGFLGFFSELQMFLISMKNSVVFTTIPPINHTILLLLLFLIQTTVTFIYFNWKIINKHLFSLVIIVVIAQLLGVYVVDFYFDKHISKIPQYYAMLLPFIVILVTFGINKYRISQVLVVLLIVFQIFFSFEKNGVWKRSPQSTFKPFASEIRSSTSNDIVVINPLFGRGNVFSLVYELEPDQLIYVINDQQSPLEIFNHLLEFEKIWLITRYPDDLTQNERMIINYLRYSTNYESNYQEQTDFTVYSLTKINTQNFSPNVENSVDKL